MNPERWAQIEELFHRAVECEPERRTGLLDEACSGDPELRQEVEALLSRERSAGDHLQAAVSVGLDAVGFPLVGETISHYRILEGLGGGGMGLVYRAEDIKLGRQVALKFLPEHSAKDLVALKRFEREARSASALEHPNICPIYEFGEHEGQPFLVMPLLEGRTLRELIFSEGPTKQPSSIDKLLDLAIQIVDGLDAAHHQGIVHRDIKPANIFVTTQGQVKILDFGLAKLQESETSDVPAGPIEEHPPKQEWNLNLTLTRTGAAIGTAGYMSPEQIRSEKLDARTDLFSFGIVLYEVAVGKRAFTGETAPLVQDGILTQTPTPVRRLNPEIPPKLERIINKALEKDPTLRYRSATEMRADLQIVKREMEPRPSLHWRELAVGIFLLLLAISAAFWFTRRQSSSSHRSLRLEDMEIVRLTDSGRAENVAISPDGRFVVYSQHEPGGVGLRVRQLASHGDVQILPAEAIGFEGLSFSPDGNYIYFVRPDSNDPGFKYLYVVPTLGGPARLLVKDIDSPISFSPDGRRFVYTRGIPTNNATELRLADADGSNNRLLATVTDTFAGFQPGATWSPDGRTIVVPLRRFRELPRFMLYAVGVTDGTVSELFPSPYSIGRALRLPDGHNWVLALGDRQGRGQLWTLSFPDKQARRLTNDLSDYDLRIDLTRDGSTLAAIEGAVVSNLWVVLGTERSGAKQITSLNLPVDSVVEAPNGKLLANTGGKVWAFTADGKQRERFTDLDRVGITTVCKHFVVLSSNRSGTAEIMRFDANGSNPTKLASGDLADPVCSPDGRYVFYVELGPPQTIWRISVEGGTPVEIAKVLGENVVGRMSVSSDGRAIAYPFEEFTPTPKMKLAIIPTEGGPPQRVLDAPGGVYSFGSPLWSPNNKSLEYILTQNGYSNIWEQPLDGRQRRQLTRFTSGRIFDFNWSVDGKRLLLSRGQISSDVVLLSNLR